MKNLHFTMFDLARGGRPRSREDLQKLWDFGVRKIISLQEGWSEYFHRFDLKHERAAWLELGGTWEHHRCSNWFPPTLEETSAVTNSIQEGLKKGAVYLHCYSGVDRTGWMAAAYKARFLKHSPEFAWKAEAWGKGTHVWFFWWKKHFLQMVSEMRGGGREQ